jgi:hypothetical protein
VRGGFNDHSYRGYFVVNGMNNHIAAQFWEHFGLVISGRATAAMDNARTIDHYAPEKS